MTNWESTEVQIQYLLPDTLSSGRLEVFPRLSNI
jgi:hypothetical protein